MISENEKTSDYDAGGNLTGKHETSTTYNSDGTKNVIKTDTDASGAKVVSTSYMDSDGHYTGESREKYDAQNNLVVYSSTSDIIYHEDGSYIKVIEETDQATGKTRQIYEDYDTDGNLLGVSWPADPDPNDPNPVEIPNEGNGTGTNQAAGDNADGSQGTNNPGSESGQSSGEQGNSNDQSGDGKDGQENQNADGQMNDGSQSSGGQENTASQNTDGQESDDKLNTDGQATEQSTESEAPGDGQNQSEGQGESTDAPKGTDEQPIEGSKADEQVPVNQDKRDPQENENQNAGNSEKPAELSSESVPAQSAQSENGTTHEAVNQQSSDSEANQSTDTGSPIVSSETTDVKPTEGQATAVEQPVDTQNSVPDQFIGGVSDVSVSGTAAQPVSFQGNTASQEPIVIQNAAEQSSVDAQSVITPAEAESNATVADSAAALTTGEVTANAIAEHVEFVPVVDNAA